jgi:hypothetical protein
MALEPDDFDPDDVDLPSGEDEPAPDEEQPVVPGMAPSDEGLAGRRPLTFLAVQIGAVRGWRPVSR